jgi:hypothetical protein
MVKTKVAQNEEEIQCEDSQQFLKKFWELKPTKQRTLESVPQGINPPIGEKNKLISEVSKGKIEIEGITPTKQESKSKIDTIKEIEKNKIVGESKGSEKTSFEFLKKKLNELKNK